MELRGRPEVYKVIKTKERWRVFASEQVIEIGGTLGADVGRRKYFLWNE